MPVGSEAMSQYNSATCQLQSPHTKGSYCYYARLQSDRVILGGLVTPLVLHLHFGVCQLKLHNE